MKQYLSILFSLMIFNLSAIELKTTQRTIRVNGKEAHVLSLTQPDGTWGMRINKGQPFDVVLRNTMEVPTSIHWHGLILPNDQDGVAFVTQFALYPGQSYHYQFPILQSGTFWMHSHVGLQEQRLLSAPLIIEDPENIQVADQEAVMFLTDFSFQSPAEIFRSLRCKKVSMPIRTPDIVDVDYDAFLTNYRTLEDPEIVEGEPGKSIRLRIINGSSSTNFFVSLGKLKGKAIAVDGNHIWHLEGSQFELGVAQRIDIVITIPTEGGSFPILAQGEGTNKQTGLIISTKGASIPQLSEQAQEKVGRLTNGQEALFRATSPLPSKPVDKKIILELGGNMMEYVWTINGQSWPEVTPIVVEKGQRIEMIFKNVTGMSHPMHLHGHVFQVTSIDGKLIEGALRDTLLVPPNSTIGIQFDANNPGVWPLHCHLLYHLEAGMFTVMRYKDFIQPLH